MEKASSTSDNTSAKQRIISVAGVGKYRSTAAGFVHLFNDTPFHFAAMLDTDGTAEPYRFTKDRLALVLRAVFPLPQVFIAGEAIDEDINKAAVEVWEEFVAEGGVERPLLINLRELEGKTLEEVKAIPKEQLLAENIMHILNSHFFPGE